MGYYEPVRAEITHVYLWNKSHIEEEIVKHFFSCDSLRDADTPGFAFDWRSVPMTSYLREFKRKSSSFCKMCEVPLIHKYSAINYEGTRSGSVRQYKCVRGFDMIGYSSSVCMVYGDWSHNAPRCRGSKKFADGFYGELIMHHPNLIIFTYSTGI